MPNPGAAGQPSSSSCPDAGGSCFHVAAPTYRWRLEAGGGCRERGSYREQGGAEWRGEGGLMQLLLLDARPLWQWIRPLQTSQAACNKQDAWCHRSTCRPGGQTEVQSAQRTQVDVGKRLKEFRKNIIRPRFAASSKRGRSLRKGNGPTVPAVGGGSGVIFNLQQHCLVLCLPSHWNGTDCL